MDFITIIIFLGIVQGILLGIGLITGKRGNRKANRILGVLMILFSFSISHSVWFNTRLYLKLPHLLMISYPVLFLFGPLFLFYVKSLISPSFKINKKDFLHFLPFLACVTYFIPFYIQDGNSKLNYFKTGLQAGFFEDILVMPLQIIHLFIYLFVVFRLQKHHQKNISNAFSSLEKINLAWIRNFIYMFIGVFGVMALLFLLSLLGFEEFIFSNAANITSLLVSVCIYGAGYLGWRQPEIFTGDEQLPAVPKYEKSSLTNELAEKYLKKLQQVMEQEKPYLNSELSIRVLAEKSGIPSYHLSRIINERMNQNFFDFINRYRIEEAARRFDDKNFQHYSILAIAEEVGFNSKSVFNTAFKKYKGETPSQFRKRLA